MNSKIIKFADLRAYEIPAELRQTTVTEEELEQLAIRFAEKYGTTEAVEQACAGCGVQCVNENGQTVFVFPGLELDGAKAAEEALKSCRVGDVTETEINGIPTTLTVTCIRINRPAQVDDELAKASGIEGVSNLDDLKTYLCEKEQEKIKTSNEKALVNLYLDYLCEQSVVELDEDELNAWAYDMAKLAYTEDMAVGIDHRFTEEGEMLEEEEAIRRMSEEYKPQFRQNLVVDRLCEDDHYKPNIDDFLAMMAPEGQPVGEDMIQAALDSDKYLHAYDILTNMVKEVLA